MTHFYAILDKYGNQIGRSNSLEYAKKQANKMLYAVAIKDVEHVIKEEVVWKKEV